MTGGMRLTRRKKQILQFLAEHDPAEIATLNELRVRSLWADGKAVNSRSHADHRKSFTRTLLEYGDPFEILDLSNTHKGKPEMLTAGIFARWAVWESIERGFLTSQPAHCSFRLYVGYDACTGVFEHSSSEIAVVGTTCYLHKLWLVSQNLTNKQMQSISNVPWKLFGSAKGDSFQKIDGTKPLWELARLPPLVALSDGKFLSMAKSSYRY